MKTLKKIGLVAAIIGGLTLGGLTPKYNSDLEGKLPSLEMSTAHASYFDETYPVDDYPMLTTPYDLGFKHVSPCYDNCGNKGADYYWQRDRTVVRQVKGDTIVTVKTMLGNMTEAFRNECGFPDTVKVIMAIEEYNCTKKISRDVKTWYVGEKGIITEDDEVTKWQLVNPNSIAGTLLEAIIKGGYCK